MARSAIPLREPPSKAIKALASQLGLEPEVIQEVAQHLVVAQLLLVSAALRPNQNLRAVKESEREGTQLGQEPLAVRISEAMRLLDLSRGSIYSLMSQGRLAWCKPDSHRRILMSSIHQLLGDSNAPAA